MKYTHLLLIAVATARQAVVSHRRASIVGISAYDYADHRIQASQHRERRHFDIREEMDQVGQLTYSQKINFAIAQLLEFSKLKHEIENFRIHDSKFGRIERCATVSGKQPPPRFKWNRHS